MLVDLHEIDAAQRRIADLRLEHEAKQRRWSVGNVDQQMGMPELVTRRVNRTKACRDCVPTNYRIIARWVKHHDVGCQLCCSRFDVAASRREEEPLRCVHTVKCNPRSARREESGRSPRHLIARNLFGASGQHPLLTERVTHARTALAVKLILEGYRISAPAPRAPSRAASTSSQYVAIIALTTPPSDAGDLAGAPFSLSSLIITTESPMRTSA